MHFGAEVCFQKWGSGGDEVLMHKSKIEHAGQASFTVWGPGARSRAPVGSRGQGPGVSPGGKAPKALVLYSIFNAKYCRKKETEYLYMNIPVLKVGVQGAKSSEAPGIYSIFNAKYDHKFDAL